MNLDTSGYYPKSHLDDETPQEEAAEIVIVEENLTPGSPQDSFDEGGLPEEAPVVTGIAHFLSWVLVPMFMPVYGIMLAFGLTILAFTGFGTRLAFTAITAAFNVAVPAIIVIILKKAGLISDIGLNDRKERFIPYLVCIVCLIGTAIFIHYKGAPLWLVMFFMGGAAAGIVEVVVNRWWKISVHAAGIAGIVALILHLMQFEYVLPYAQTWLLISVGAAGLLGSARIWLGRHTLWQVMAGYAVGFCSVYFLMLA